MRVAIGGISHETNTFSVVHATEDYFKKYEWEYGQEILDNHTGVGDYFGGMISKAQKKGITLLPAFSARANPSGIITQETYELMKTELINRIEAMDDLDGVCLALHGAGVAEGVDDIEGDILQAVRQVVGETVPVAATLDLHANMTEKMVKEADVLFGVNHYPHTDCYERGEEALDNLLRIINGELKPVMCLERLPMIIPTSTTYLSPVKDINELCWELETKEEVVDCTFFHGFCHTDIPEVKVSVLSITNNDFTLAEEVARRAADQIWERRDEFFIKLPDPHAAVKQAVAVDGGPVVINETSDNPGAGAPGDGTRLLDALLKQNLPRSCFGFMYDPEVVYKAIQAGPGNSITVKLGGKTDNLHGESVEITAYVKSLTDGQFLQSSQMDRGKSVNRGLSTRLKVGNVDIIVCSVRSQTFDEQIFKLHGIDVAEYKIVALKSSNHFRAAFEPIAKKIITADSPGLSSFNLHSFNYKRLHRPVLPLDGAVQRSEKAVY
ncbi:M81 family metallopeptidase [Evansella clarkii]|uniref:M81 family metallopeptidase n=1 Tax=Evansella clarkii TaxID=79879 RepID=UPI000B4425AB|nr:M81 family metallopeptidase [Evansella clarkii]